MIFVVESEEKKQQKAHEEQLTVLDMRTVHDLIDAAREAHMVGYDFVEIDKLERGILALASLHGINVFNVEEALLLLAERGEAVTKENKELEAKNKELADEVDHLKNDPTGAVIIDVEQQANTSDVLIETGEALTRVPGQRVLAQKAIHTAHLLNELKPQNIFVVAEEE